jgi:hypothetical protein
MDKSESLKYCQNHGKIRPALINQMPLLGLIMRHKYAAAVVGCIAHAAGVTWSSYLYGRSGPSGGSPLDFPRVIFALALIWPLWALAIWCCATKARVRATVIPMIIGLLLISPTYLGFLTLFAAPVPQ